MKNWLEMDAADFATTGTQLGLFQQPDDCGMADLLDNGKDGGDE